MPHHRFVPSIRDSEIVVCRRCNTRQYPRNGACVRCHGLLGLYYLHVPVGSWFSPDTLPDEKQLARTIGALLRSLRKRRGITQSQLAMEAAGCIVRTYLSKAECGHVLLPVSKLLRIAEVLGLTAMILRFETTSSLAAHRSDHDQRGEGAQLVPGRNSPK